MSIIVLAFLIGVVAGLRALTPPAVVSWAAHLGHLPVAGSWLAFLGFWATPYILTLLAVVELVGDKLPQTPSRKAAMPFAVRIVSGAIGAVMGTLGGYEFRSRLVKAIGGRDLPIALLEDAIAIIAAILITAGA
jgi:uncharacterized membrane protein